MSRTSGRSDGETTTQETGRLFVTVVVVGAMVLSIPVGYVASDVLGAPPEQAALSGDNGQPQALTGDTGEPQVGGVQAQPVPVENYTVRQGDDCVTITPITTNETVTEFYDYRTPVADNEYTNATGTSYSSEGTIEFQEPNGSVLFLHRNRTGTLSLVAVHGALNETSAGGSASFDVSGLPENGTWAVRDDEYDDESSVDNWSVVDGNASIDWTWAEARTDGFTFEGLGETFNVTVDPAFNENATLFGDYYNGTIENWTVVSNVTENDDVAELNETDNRTELNLSSNATISTLDCDVGLADGGGAPTPPGAGGDDPDGDGGAPPPVDEEPDDGGGGGAEPPAEDPDTGEPATEEPVTEEPPTEEPVTEEPETVEPETEEPETDEPEAELEDIDLGLESTDIARDETTQATVTASYEDGTEEDVTDAATITTGNDMIATASGSTITGVNPGDTDVTAEFEGETDSESLSVEIGNSSPPELQGFVWDRQGTSDEFAVEWSATDDEGDLAEVTVELLNGDSVVAAADTAVDGGFASGTTTVTGAGADAVRGVVTDAEGNQDERTLGIGGPPAADEEEPLASEAANAANIGADETPEPGAGNGPGGDDAVTPEPGVADGSDLEEEDTPEPDEGNDSDIQAAENSGIVQPLG